MSQANLAGRATLPSAAWRPPALPPDAALLRFASLRRGAYRNRTGV